MEKQLTTGLGRRRDTVWCTVSGKCLCDSKDRHPGHCWPQGSESGRGAELKVGWGWVTNLKGVCDHQGGRVPQEERREDPGQSPTLSGWQRKEGLPLWSRPRTGKSLPLRETSGVDLPHAWSPTDTRDCNTQWRESVRMFTPLLCSFKFLKSGSGVVA